MTEYLKLKKSNCKNCYKCIRHCPVKAIRFSGDQAHIVPEECILCGNCFKVCPQGAKSIKSDVEKANVILAASNASGGEVYASVAPSFAAAFRCGIGEMNDALRGLGFTGVEETAVGATIVKKEYEKLVAPGNDVLEPVISSCCPSVNLMIQKHFPEALPYLAPVITPAQAHAENIRLRYPGAKVIFIGPCISKKAETDMYPGYADCALTFEELSEMLAAKKLFVTKNPPEAGEDTGRARTFPTPGGILSSMDKDGSPYEFLSVDGIENCVDAVREIIEGGMRGCFVEMSACTGSCTGGPVMKSAEPDRHELLENRLLTCRYAGSEDFEITGLDAMSTGLVYGNLRPDTPEPTEKDIEDILALMGKKTPADELNCGTCGYDTCREKAAAVWAKKADLTMCLPYLKEKAETVSNSIIENTPNGIMVLNSLLEVQRLNTAARNILELRRAGDILGENVIRILDPAVFLGVVETKKDVFDRRMYLAEYDKYISLTVVFDSKFEQLIVILRDITDEELERKKRLEISRNTIDVTNKVIEKQMTVVQEVASLLGETTAEMKVALIKLGESLKNE